MKTFCVLIAHTDHLIFLRALSANKSNKCNTSANHYFDHVDLPFRKKQTQKNKQDFNLWHKLIIVNRPEDFQSLKGQKGIIVAIPFNLWHVPETPLNKTSSADAPISGAKMGLKDFNLLRSDALEYFKPPRCTSKI